MPATANINKENIEVDESCNIPVRKFKFLKRGEGTARFGKLGNPRPSCTTSSSTDHNQQVEVGQLKRVPLKERTTNWKKGPGMAAAATPPSARLGGDENGGGRRLGSESGCEDTPLSHPSPHSLSLSDTNHFEQMERDIHDSSLSADSTFYRRFTSTLHKFPERRKSSPRITEVHGEMEEEGKERLAAGSDKESTSSKESGSLESGRIGSLRSCERGGDADPPSSRPLPPSHHPSAPARTMLELPRPPPVFPEGEVRGGREREGLKDVDKLVGVLRARLALFDRDYADFMERERDAMERFEMQKESLLEYEKELNSRKEGVEKERKDFEKYKSQEMADIRKARETVEKQRVVVDKKESEQLKILKEQIVDLQNDICERDSRWSSQRAKIRDLELKHSRLTSELKEAKSDIQRSTERTRTLEDTNAQLRLRLSSAKFGSSPSLPAMTELRTPPDSLPASSGRKSVRFEVEGGRDWERTDNRETQTSILSPAPELASSPYHIPVKTLENSQDHMIDIDRTLPDGSRETIYRNGTSRLVASDGQTLTFRYRNGDSRRILPDGTEVYCYCDKGVTHVMEPGGERVVRFPDGREERHLPDGTTRVRLGDRETVSSPDGHRVESYSDGTRLVEGADGLTTVFFKDGSKETRSKDFTRREWPSGDVKIVYSDGTVESKYKDGRVRIKDSQGLLLRDEYLLG